MKASLTSFVFVMTALLWVDAAMAATCAVPGQYASIQDAVDDLSCDTVDVAAGSYPGAVTVPRTLVIRGAGRDQTIIGETVTIVNSGPVTLQSLAIQFTSGDGIVLSSTFSTVIGDDIEVSFNPGEGVGFAPAASDAVADLRNCLITDNQRGVNARNIRMDNCVVLFNGPLGGIRVGVGGAIRNSVIQANTHTTLTGDGGGILFDGPGGSTLEVEDSLILGNVSNSSSPLNNTSDGGGIMNREGFLFVRRSEIRGNIAGRWGGGIANSDVFGSNVEIHDSIIEQNFAYGGGGGVGAGDAMEIYNSSIQFNQALYDEDENANGLGVGGGIYQFEDRLVLENVRVVGNQAKTQSGQTVLFDGGGLYVNTTQLTRISHSSFIDNLAEGDGGGLWIGSTANLVNVTVAGNEAGGNGGGIYGAFAPSIAHGTIVDNTAGGDGGGISNSATVNHTVIGHNEDTSAAPNFRPDCAGGVVSSGFSLLRIGDGCAVFNGGSNNVIGTAGSPLSLGLLRPATDNGGPVETVALDPRSPAVDAGEKECELAVPTDARGFSRAGQDGNGDKGGDGNLCDLGAYEVFSGCQAAPLLLRGFELLGTESFASETSLSTAPVVTIGESGEVRFVASDEVALGTGFSVAVGGALGINVGGNVSCD